MSGSGVREGETCLTDVPGGECQRRAEAGKRFTGVQRVVVMSRGDTRGHLSACSLRHRGCRCHRARWAVLRDPSRARESGVQVLTRRGLLRHALHMRGPAP